MINNRQAGRRNRGRNNGRPNGGNRGGDNGNRIDNRARGNAPQLLEKYRNLARDAQLAGDRVNTEYYLQFADHYFRVLADNRARQEEHQARFRRNDDNLDDDADQGDDGRDDLMEGEVVAQGGRNDGRQVREGRRDRSRIQITSDADTGDGEQGIEEAESRQRGRRAEKIRITPPSFDDKSGDADPAADTATAEEADAAPRRAPRGRKPRQPREEAQVIDEAPGFDLAALPPAIARADNDSGTDDGDDADKPAPRRRGRRPKASAEAAE